MSIICFLAYRCITQKPLQFFLDNKETFKQHDETSGSNKAEVHINQFNISFLIHRVNGYINIDKNSNNISTKLTGEKVFVR